MKEQISNDRTMDCLRGHEWQRGCSFGLVRQLTPYSATMEDIAIARAHWPWPQCGRRDGSIPTIIPITQAEENSIDDKATRRENAAGRNPVVHPVPTSEHCCVRWREPSGPNRRRPCSTPG